MLHQSLCPYLQTGATKIEHLGLDNMTIDEDHHIASPPELQSLVAGQLTLIANDQKRTTQFNEQEVTALTSRKKHQQPRSRSTN